MRASTVRVDIGTTELAVDDLGAGDPVLVLHGFTGSASAMAPLTGRLARSRRVLVPDLVGHGRSDVPDDPAAYSIEAMVGHVVAVARAAGLARFDLLGYSMGGRLALTLACTDPTGIRSLVLVGASPGLSTAAARAARRRSDEAMARRIEVDLEGFVDDWMAGPLLSDQSRLGDRFVTEARAQRLASDPAGLAASLRAAGTGSMDPVHDRLERCRVPTMLIVGETDEKFRGIAEEMANRLPDARIAVIESAGHAAHVERPDVVADMIGSFLDEHAGR